MKATSYQPPKSAIFRSAFVALWWSCALHDAGLAQSPEQSVENRKSEEIAPASEILPAIPAVEATATTSKSSRTPARALPLNACSFSKPMKNFSTGK